MISITEAVIPRSHFCPGVIKIRLLHGMLCKFINDALHFFDSKTFFSCFILFSYGSPNTILKGRNNKQYFRIQRVPNIVLAIQFQYLPVFLCVFFENSLIDIVCN